MKTTLKSLIVSVLAVAFATTLGCSTTGNFRIPADHTLRVTDRTVVLDQNNDYKTSPFFWSEAGGAPYQLMDKDGKIVRSGKLKMNFRVASIFWPPFAIIYWPMGFNKAGFDLTRPGDGYQVTDNQPSPMAVSPSTTQDPKKAKK